ncbi:ATP-binding protein [Cellvibrio sp. NN19]|uniref:ATP-binding protein n=1 Tax=Cellvibrio chitinivorans TaxID=3102792 RepID=UPI002B40C2CA|nr:ATP-binding protein [Cellvibrio sp. NN19]
MIQYLITALIDIAVGFLALSKKDNPAAKALALTVFSLGAWSLELYLLTVIKNLDALTVLFHVTRWGMFFIPSAFAFLTWRLIGSRSKKFKNYIVVPSFALSIALCIGNTFIFPSTLRLVDGGYLPNTDAIFYFFLVNFLWCFVGSIGMVLASYKTSPKREKQRLKWLLITLTVSFVGGTLGIYSMPSEFYLSRFVGSITNIVFVALLFYSTIQHNLMDFRLAISLGLSKAIVLGFFVWLYFVVSSVIGDHTEPVGGVIVLLLFVTLMLEAYPRLLKWLIPNAKKILAGHDYDYQRVKEETEKALGGSINFANLIDILDKLFLKTLRITNYKILLIKQSVDSDSRENIYKQNNLIFEFVSDSDPLVNHATHINQLLMADEMPESLQIEMKKHDAALCFPVSSEHQVIAIVMIGTPTNLSYYRYDDIKIFEWIKTELGQALERLIRLNSMQDQLGEAKKTLSMLSLMNHYHHDIKAPFAIIDGVLSNDIYDRDKQKDIVLAQVERGSKLIATMAGILGGNHKRRIQSCSLEALIQDCLFLFEKSFDKIEYSFGGVPNIRGDAEDLKILFINLIKNATEARRGDVELRISVKSWLNHGNVYLSISDNGTGMTEQQLANLWEPGFSVKKFGNGIGMQAIKRIADEHNAHISVKSEFLQGSEFTLCFFSSQIAHQDGGATDELAERRAGLQEKRNTL